MAPDPPKPHHGDCDDAHVCPLPPNPPDPHPGGHRRLVTTLVITASVLVFFFIVSLSIYCLVRRLRRRRQQQQQSLLAAEAANPVPGDEGDAASDVEMGAAAALDVDWEPVEDQDDEVAHHAWHIRTVGLDEAAIESIALMRYRVGAGMLGATDCSVCLGEFMDGELLRLLPACSHAFHVPCIDTWLRAHVNCPLCRAHVVLDPAVGTGVSAGSNADTGGEQTAISIEAMDHELDPDQQLSEPQDLRVQIDERHQSISPEPLHRQPGSRVQGFRRAASMDLRRPVSTEDEPNSKGNQGNSGAAACCKLPSGSGRLYHMKRSLSGGGGGRWPLASRHYHTRSSMLPS